MILGSEISQGAPTDREMPSFTSWNAIFAVFPQNYSGAPVTRNQFRQMKLNLETSGVSKVTIQMLLVELIS